MDTRSEQCIIGMVSHAATDNFEVVIISRLEHTILIERGDFNPHFEFVLRMRNCHGYDGSIGLL